MVETLLRWAHSGKSSYRMKDERCFLCHRCSPPRITIIVFSHIHTSLFFQTYVFHLRAKHRFNQAFPRDQPPVSISSSAASMTCFWRKKVPASWNGVAGYSSCTARTCLLRIFSRGTSIQETLRPFADNSTITDSFTSVLSVPLEQLRRLCG